MKFATRTLHRRAPKTSSSRSPARSSHPLPPSTAVWSIVGGITSLREKGVDVPRATTVGGISLADEPSKVERNRDLARRPTPYTVHGKLGMISSAEFRALWLTPLECHPRDKGGRERERARAQFVEILPNVSSYRTVSLVITRPRGILRKLPPPPVTYPGSMEIFPRNRALLASLTRVDALRVSCGSGYVVPINQLCRVSLDDLGRRRNENVVIYRRSHRRSIDPRCVEFIDDPFRKPCALRERMRITLKESVDSGTR